ILVSMASKHGATADIGRAIADVINEEGIEARISLPEDVVAVDDFDAVILGSAVYAGRWMKSMKELVDRHGTELRKRPVWLFSSGPVGDPPKPEEEPVDVAPIVEATGARGHSIFAGKLERKVLSFGERAIVTAFKVPDGDFRDWSEIGEWAREIATELKTKV
ncbi:MAG TPA: flavodoxin domain-containing protein, partial [Acidimicrobiia bacterium]